MFCKFSFAVREFPINFHWHWVKQYVLSMKICEFHFNNSGVDSQECTNRCVKKEVSTSSFTIWIRFSCFYASRHAFAVIPSADYNWILNSRLFVLSLLLAVVEWVLPLKWCHRTWLEHWMISVDVSLRYCLRSDGFIDVLLSELVSWSK